MKRCRTNHDDYFTYDDFIQKKYFHKLPEVFNEEDRHKLHTFLNCMSDLTGVILLKKKTVAENLWKYAATGFIAKIERQRHCPPERVPTNSPYAIVTITTTYHTFNDYNEESEAKFEAVNEIWNKMTTWFVLDHNSRDTNDDNYGANNTQRYDSDNHSDNLLEDDVEKANKSSEEDDSDKGSKNSEDDSDKGSKSSEDGSDKSSTSSDGIPMDYINFKNKLIGDRLIETDKDLEFENDWCAFECVVDDPELIEKLETLVKNYQNLMAELYKKSQEQKYKDVNLVVIFGHPHYLAKRMSIGKTRDFASAPKRKILKEVRSSQIWCRYSYDNATCKGSSGSPIFIWGQPISGLGYWFGHPHNHSSGNQIDGVCIGKSTIGVEHIV